MMTLLGTRFSIPMEAWLILTDMILCISVLWTSLISSNVRLREIVNTEGTNGGYAIPSQVRRTILI